MRTFLIACALASCGDPLVDQQYLGDVRLRIRGNPGGEVSIAEADHDTLKLSMFWVKGLMPVMDFGQYLEQPSTAIPFRLPWSFDWLIYDEPEPSQFAMSPPDARYALGLPLIYADRNQNGRHDAVEPFYGQAPVSAILMTPQALRAEQSPTGHAVPAGFRLISFPLGCRPEPPMPRGPDDCGVPLGEPCASDADCGNGVCLLQEPWPWPAGTCAVPEVPGGCHPATGALWRNHKMGGRDYWLKACSTDAECRQLFPYMCDLNQNVCLPSAHMQLRLEADLRPQPICRRPPMP